MNPRALALAALLPASFVFAHDFGGSVSQARMAASTTIEIDPGKVLSIAHNALHWRADVLGRVKSGQSKQRYAPHSWYNKVAAAQVPAEMVLGGKAIVRGEWTVSVKIPGDDTSRFLLEWKQGDKIVDVPLDMQGGNDVEDHLLFALTPRGGADSKAFELKVYYGDLRAAVEGSFGGQPQ